MIDAAEFLAPANDQSLGLHRIAPILAFPGFNKPNGASELVIHQAGWLELPQALKTIIEAAARMEHDMGLAEAYRTNQRALREVLGAGATLKTISPAILAHAAKLAVQQREDIGLRDDLSSRIAMSYARALEAQTSI